MEARVGEEVLWALAGKGKRRIGIVLGLATMALTAVELMGR